MTMNLEILTKTAIKAAKSAGEVIKKYSSEPISVETKQKATSYAAQVVTIADKAAEQTILSYLLPTCEQYDIALLSEETEDDKSRFNKDYFWCIDPLDGTLPFINNYPGFAVSIALVAKDGTPIIGVVHDSSTDNTYHAIQGKGAYKNDSLWKIPNTNTHLTYITDRQLKDTPHAEEILDMLQKKAMSLNLDRVKVISGSGSVMNAILVLENGPACMMKRPKEQLGGGSLWDYAATACIFNELGLEASNYNGGKLDLNKKGDTYMNHEGVWFGNW